MTRQGNAAGSGDARRRKEHFKGAKREAKYNTARNHLALLDRLDGLKQTGADRWIARCPAHEDRSPSLSIRDVGDRLLIHDHAGCSPADILASVGLELADLFDGPINTGPAPRRDRIRVDYRETLRAIRHDLIVVGIIATDFAKSGTLDDETREQLGEAAQFLLNAAEVAA